MSEYSSGYKHGVKDMHTHALMLLHELQRKVGTFAIAGATCDHYRKKLNEKYDAMTKETE
ncbi:MAG: hypothetical protein ACYSWO_27680 [Planctomycetota bacterium]|jgi:hypothetical protein